MAENATDEYLTQQVQKGNQEAFFTLYNRYLTKVYNRVKSRIPLTDVEDVTQEIFVAVVRSIKNFKGESTFNTWLYTIVNRQIADYYRHHTRKKEPNQVEDIDSDSLSFDLVDDQINWDESAELRHAIEALPEHYREIILLRFADGLTFATIAEQRGQTLEATKSLYRRAIQAVRDIIDGE
jgi:RNA polymerase sigma-70 factor (ECF subfamily)